VEDNEAEVLEEQEEVSWTGTSTVCRNQQGCPQIY
jgi:hypothetical protein